MDGVGSPSPFPFFKLPAEIRNMIYGLVVITDQCLDVRDMHRQEFGKSQKNGTYRSRSTYRALDHPCPCSRRFGTWAPAKTTYTLDAQHADATMTTTMLSLDRKSREEVVYIFYGGNTFCFTTMSSLMPFMKDRRAESRKCIQNIWLRLVIDDLSWDPIFVERGTPAMWNTAFSSVLKLTHVNIKKLCIQVLEDTRLKLVYNDSSLRSRSMLWLRKLGRFENLEMLGLQHTELPSPVFHYFRYGMLVDESVRGKIKTGSEDALWRFLAPRMLKKEADDHSPEALQRRRIRGFPNTHRSSRT